MTTLSVSEELGRRIREQVASEQYASADEVLRAAMDALAEQDREDEDKLAWFRNAWTEGLATDVGGSFDLDEMETMGRALRSTRS